MVKLIINFNAYSLLVHCVIIYLCTPSITLAQEKTGTWSGNIAAQGRWFWESPQFDDQRDGDISVSFEPEYYKDWNNGLRAITFAPFGRLDSTDPERTHADIREAHYLHVVGDWEWRIGVAEVFWGVTESQHLVDIINQTDLVESIDTERETRTAHDRNHVASRLGLHFNFTFYLDFESVLFRVEKGRLSNWNRC